MHPKHVLTIFILLALVLSASPAHAGGIVTTCDEAHLLAALAGGGTITFTCSGTIALTSEITIAANTTIDGSGQTVTISGNHAVRVMVVNPGITLSLNKLTIADGYNPFGYGSGIFNNFGTMTVSDSILSGHESDLGGGIYNSGGTLTVSNSTFANNNCGHGGGILNGSGTVIVSGSTFYGNNCVGGAGIFSHFGTLTVSNSTFFGNSALNGGGINNSDGTMTISISTFSGNSATYFGNYGNGGGIYNSAGTVTLKNTIVADSPVGGNCFGTITDGSGNLVYGDTTCPGINSNPQLGPLQNNGGSTATMALLTGSAARDAANDATCAAAPVNNLDQRGVTRPQGVHCDIGAYEAQPPCPNFVPPATVGIEDIQAIVARWGWTTSTPGWDPAFDLNGDNKIDIIDIMLVTAAWGSTCA